ILHKSAFWASGPLAQQLIPRPPRAGFLLPGETHDRTTHPAPGGRRAPACRAVLAGRGPQMKLTENFTLREFERSATADRLGIDNKVPAELLPNARQVACWLQALRDRLGRS